MPSELHEANRREDERFAVLAHELRNALAPLRNALEVLRIAVDEPRSRSSALDLIDRQAAHLARLVDDLLDASRVSRSGLEIRREPVAIRDVVQAAVDVVRPQLEARGHTLSLDIARDAWVTGDRARLVQVLINLLQNAGRFTPRGGRVAVRVAVADGSVAIAVRDSGIGIPQAAQARVSELLHQQAAPLEPAQRGLGIGLSLARLLTELHGGRVTLASDGAGAGAEFTVTLPALARPPEPDAAAGGPPPARRPLRLLIVEDDTDAADGFRLLLERRGHRVCVADSGLAALRAAAEFAPDVMLVDLKLPDIDGFEVAERLLAEARPERPPVLVALSGYGRDEDERRADQAGFAIHLTKPVPPERLDELLRRLVAEDAADAALVD